jgi:RNA polymerase sigma-70 factor (ECF subfamily)
MLEGLVASNPTSPESILEKKELSHIVREAIDSLKFEHRVVLILFYLENFSLKEIAYILNCPIGTVKSRLYYGRRNLKRKLMSDRILEGEVAYELP